MLCVVNVNQTKKQNRKYQPKKKTKHTTNHQKWHKNVNVRSFFFLKKCTSKCLICRLNKWRLNTFSH